MVGDSPAEPASVQSVTANGFSWTDVERPTRAEADDLALVHGLFAADVDLALDRRQASRILRRERYLLAVVCVPLLSNGGQGPATTTSPVAIFIRPTSLVTMHAGDVRPFRRLFQQLRLDALARDLAFAGGVDAVLYAIVQRLVDAATTAQGRLDQAIAAQEADLARSDLLAALGVIAQLRREARDLRRVVGPLPMVIRGIGSVDLGLTARVDWEDLARRSDRLVEALDDAVDAIREMLLAANAAANLRGAAQLRTLTAIAALTLPVIVVATLLAMPPTSPLAGQANGFALSLAIAGVVFLTALAILKGH
ncbi:MAG TPA: CorA family divalent cation transporter [Chloroflexota bacterium]|nr:CorA family divalent cation transporter [Chloroflexota bacterium]